MSISGLSTISLHSARFSVKLLMGAWLLACLPAMAETTRFQEPVLVAQGISLREGSRNPAVIDLQQALDQRGLFPYAIDGVYGPATTQAVRQFQSIRRLPVTGIADADTLDELGIDPDRLFAGLYHPDYGAISTDRLEPGSSTTDVSILQSVLRSFGFTVAVDGIYGGGTVRAVRSYQRTAELAVNGTADRSTLLHMGFESNDSRSGRRSNRRSGRSGNSSDSDTARYIAAIIADRSELNAVRRDFPNATIDSNRQGDYINLGRFVDRSDANARVDFARDLGYDARVLRD